MSWEGYTQNLCTNGHEFATGIPHFLAYLTVAEVCPICSAKIAWRHIVDETNGIEEGNQGTYPVKLEVKTPAGYCTCEKCNNIHMVKHPTYHIPNRERESK